MKNLRNKVTLIGLGLLFGSVAQAALVTQWSLKVDSKFIQSSIVDSDNISPGGVTFNSATSLSWGNGGQSGLDIGGSPSSTLVNTNGIAVNNVTITHRNQPIQPPTLRAVDIASTLTLTPNVPLGGPALPDAVQTFKIKFLETPNGGGTCPDGAPNNFGVNINGCSDIFVIDSGSLNFPFLYDTDADFFGDDPVLYFISFFEATAGLNPLSAAACLAVTGSNAACLGFQTIESTNNTIQFAARITTQPVSVNVPEPGTVALAGLALGLLAVIRRRRS